jgi:hypothetical protein
MRKTKLRGVMRVGFEILLTVTGFNLIRMRNLLATEAVGRTDGAPAPNDGRVKQDRRNSHDGYSSTKSTAGARRVGFFTILLTVQEVLGCQRGVKSVRG